MYVPYLRGKQFELEALLEVPNTVFRTTLPIVEPVNDGRGRAYQRLAAARVPFIFILNPYHPVRSRMTTAQVEEIINTQMPGHASLVYGFIVDQRFNLHDLTMFLTTYRLNSKAIIFRFSPLPIDLNAIQNALNVNPVDYVVFDDRRTNPTTRISFNAHPRKVLLTDGFQRQDRNADYPAVSAFETSYLTYRADGWWGLGDYLSVGDHFQEGGGPVYVVTLHVTTQVAPNLVMNHFSSTVRATVAGFAPIKFAEANETLVGSPNVIPLRTVGLDIFRDWNARGHNPQLGAAKKASLMHHIELMSTLV